MDDLSNVELLQRLGLAILAGLLLGLEREWRRKAAGLRTHALVAEGAALFMMGSLLLGEQMRAAGSTGYDPSRIGSTIVQGVGFIAGGVILARHGRISGLTTAVDIWVTAAIGMLIGSGFYFLAISATIVTVVVLGPLRIVESRVTRSKAGSEVEEDEGQDDRNAK
ncbi:MAG TPA: MgtC/SapB family protein [Thermomicrobiales bacterium]|nr:MgtC/SapB family protein [Thermomicrobiales bacterium]